jgi:DNA helicase MCM8
LSEEASALIQEFYMELRQKHRSGEGTPITTRQLESMIRLSEARARCELRDIVTAADARDIIQIMKYSLWDSYSSDDLGTVDFARSQMGTGSSRQKDGKNLMAVLNRKAYETGKKNFTMDQIEKFAYDINIREGVRELVDRVNNQGYLINKGGGVYQITM